jgi:hypothetical protein
MSGLVQLGDHQSLRLGAKPRRSATSSLFFGLTDCAGSGGLVNGEGAPSDAGPAILYYKTRGMAGFFAPDAIPRREEAMDWGITAEDIDTLRETLRGSISMFTMLLAECEPGSETHKVVSAAIRRRRRILAKIEAAILEAGIEAAEISGGSAH